MKLEALEVLKNRRAIRTYRPEQITDEALNAVLEEGTFAPTGGTQGVKIVAVQTPENVAAVDALNAKVPNNSGAHPYYARRPYCSSLRRRPASPMSWTARRFAPIC